MTTATPLAGYDATKGVAIRNPNSSGGAFAGEGSNVGFFAVDYWVSIFGVQIKSVAGRALYGIIGNIIAGNIIDGGSAPGSPGGCATVWQDNITVMANNLILSHGCIGISFKYGNSFALWNTIVNVGSVSAPVAIDLGSPWVFQPSAVANNAIFGFSHIAARWDTVDVPAAWSTGNVTDLAGTDNTGTTWFYDGTTVMHVVELPGITYGTSGASMFISPGSDYRPNSALISAGSAFGSFYINCLPSQVPAICTPFMQSWDTPDILGNTRPNGSSQWSTGAEQHP
jgi:hypothetical protein